MIGESNICEREKICWTQTVLTITQWQTQLFFLRPAVIAAAVEASDCNESVFEQYREWVELPLSPSGCSIASEVASAANTLWAGGCEPAVPCGSFLHTSVLLTALPNFAHGLKTRPCCDSGFIRHCVRLGDHGTARRECPALQVVISAHSRAPTRTKKNVELPRSEVVSIIVSTKFSM